MKKTNEHNALIAAYHTGRLSPEDAESVRARCAQDPVFAAEVESLAPVADWLQRGFESRPAANYRLSSDRLAVIRAAARGDIVAFPERAVPAARKRSRVMRATRRYGLATAAALAMMVGAVSGFESGRFQFVDQARPTLLAIDAQELAERDVSSDAIHYFPPAYGLDHANLSAMTSRASTVDSVRSAGFTVSPYPDYGLPGPGSPYLRSREILFLQ